MFRFEKLEIWHESVAYGKNIYKIADKLPMNENFGLKSQLKRASLSISSNIAEGSGSNSDKDFRHFLNIAVKSVIETVSQLKFAYEMNYFNLSEVDNLYNQAEILIKRIKAFSNSLK